MEAIEVAPESPDMDCSRRRTRADFTSRGISRKEDAVATCKKEYGLDITGLLDMERG